MAIYGNEIGRPKICDFVNPYRLGYFQRCSYEPMRVFGIDFNRSLLFTREPKYISSILLATLASTLVSTSNKSWKINVLILHILALLFVMSLTAIVVLLSSFILLYIRLSAFSFTLIAIMIPLIILPIINVIYLQNFDDPNNFLMYRLVSVSGSFSDGISTNLSLMGTGITKDLRIIEDTMLYKIYGQYGVVGFILCFILFYLIVKESFVYNSLHYRDLLTDYGLMVVITSLLFFNLYFLSDIINFYFIFLALTLLFVPMSISARNYKLS